jgi:hypothetical protein
MKREESIRMAWEAGAAYDEGLTYFEQSDLQRFANLVAAHKAEVALAEAYRCGYKDGMEAAALVCEKTDDGTPYNLANECAAAIRARGTT